MTMVKKNPSASCWCSIGSARATPTPEFAPFLELDHLRVMIAQPEYLLAMKCIALRIGAEFHDEDDVRFLLRWLNVESVEQATGIIERFYPIDRIPQKTLYALGEILTPGSSRG